MGKKGEVSSTANFKKAAISLLEHNGKWKDVPASLKGAFTCRAFMDNP